MVRFSSLLDFRNTGLSFGRPLTSYSKVCFIWSELIRGRAFQLQQRRVLSSLYLNVGCGPNAHPNFINLDYSWRPGIDLCWDIRKPLPLRPGLLKGIYTEHCLEHLSYSDGLTMLRHFRQLLAPGGTLRIVVPDAGLYLDLYEASKSGESPRFPYLPCPLPDNVSPLMAVSRVFQDHGHLSAYDAATLANVMTTAGLVHVRREAFRIGADPVLLIDSEYRAVESLYMEANA